MLYIIHLLGTLSAVSSLSISSQNSLVNLTWTAPFTLDIDNIDPDITYCVDVINYTSSMMLHSECDILTTEYSYPIPPTIWCGRLGISVTPMNGAGLGVPNSVSFPQADISSKQNYFSCL